MACKYALIAFEDSEGEASEWMYELPRYLRGEVSEGDWVAVMHDGRFKVGRVSALRPVCPYSARNVGLAIGRVPVDEWERCKRDRESSELLIRDMAERRARLDELDAYRAAAEGDAEMREMLEAYDELTGDGAAAAPEDGGPAQE